MNTRLTQAHVIRAEAPFYVTFYSALSKSFGLMRLDVISAVAFSTSVSSYLPVPGGTLIT
jgi:hypothetical protein